AVEEKRGKDKPGFGDAGRPPVVQEKIEDYGQRQKEQQVFMGAKEHRATQFVIVKDDGMTAIILNLSFGVNCLQKEQLEKRPDSCYNIQLLGVYEWTISILSSSAQVMPVARRRWLPPGWGQRPSF